jgi:hypothetical protein
MAGRGNGKKNAPTGLPFNTIPFTSIDSNALPAAVVPTPRFDAIVEGPATRVGDTQHAVVPFVNPMQKVNMQMESMKQPGRYLSVKEVYNQLDKSNYMDVQMFLNNVKRTLKTAKEAADEFAYEAISLKHDDSNVVLKDLLKNDVAKGNQYGELVAAYTKVKKARENRKERFHKLFHEWNYGGKHYPAWTSEAWWNGIPGNLMEDTTAISDALSNHHRSNGLNWTPLELVRRASYMSILRQAGLIGNRGDDPHIQPIDIKRAHDFPEMYNKQEHAHSARFQEVLMRKELELVEGIYWTKARVPDNYLNLIANAGDPKKEIKKESTVSKNWRLGTVTGTNPVQSITIQNPPPAPATAAPASRAQRQIKGPGEARAGQPLPSQGTKKAAPKTGSSRLSTGPLMTGPAATPATTLPPNALQSIAQAATTLTDARRDAAIEKDIADLFEDFPDPPQQDTNFGVDSGFDPPRLPPSRTIAQAGTGFGYRPQGAALSNTQLSLGILPGNLRNQNRPGPPTPPPLFGPGSGNDRTIVQPSRIDEELTRNMNVSNDRSRFIRSGSTGLHREDLDRSLQRMSVQEVKQRWGAPVRAAGSQPEKITRELIAKAPNPFPMQKRRAPTPSMSAMGSAEKRHARYPTPEQIAAANVQRVANEKTRDTDPYYDRGVIDLRLPIKNPTTIQTFAWSLVLNWAQQRLNGTKPIELQDEEVRTIQAQGPQAMMLAYSDILASLPPSKNLTQSNMIYFLAKACIARCEELERAKTKPAGTEQDIVDALSAYARVIGTKDVKLRSGNMHHGGVSLAIQDLARLERREWRDGRLSGDLIIAGIAAGRNPGVDKCNVIPFYDWDRFMEGKQMQYWGNEKWNDRYIVVHKGDHWFLMHFKPSGQTGKPRILVLDSAKKNPLKLSEPNLSKLLQFIEPIYGHTEYHAVVSNQQDNDYDCGMWVIENFKILYDYDETKIKTGKVSLESRTLLIEAIQGAVLHDRENERYWSAPPRQQPVATKKDPKLVEAEGVKDNNIRKMLPK